MYNNFGAGQVYVWNAFMQCQLVKIGTNRALRVLKLCLNFQLNFECIYIHFSGARLDIVKKYFPVKYFRLSTWVPIISETKTDRDIPFFACYARCPKE